MSARPRVGLFVTCLVDLVRPGIARAGNAIVGGGVVTSGTLSPCLGVGIGMAYVPAAQAAIGTRLQIDVRGKMRPAVVKRKPLYAKRSNPDTGGS